MQTEKILICFFLFGVFVVHASRVTTNKIACSWCCLMCFVLICLPLFVPSYTAYHLVGKLQNELQIVFPQGVKSPTVPPLPCQHRGQPPNKRIKHDSPHSHTERSMRVTQMQQRKATPNDDHILSTYKPNILSMVVCHAETIQLIYSTGR